MSRFEKFVGVGTIVIATLSLPVSLPLAYESIVSPPASSPSTPEEGDTNTHVVRDEAGDVTAVVPDAPSPHYTIDSIASPSEREWSDEPVALVHDPVTNVSIVYPATLPPCDSDDGTAVSNHLLVAACKWDGGDDSFIVIAP
jgi:hypothetical protein